MGCTHPTMNVWRLTCARQSVLPFHHMGPENPTQVTRLCSCTQLTISLGSSHASHTGLGKQHGAVESTGNERLALLRFHHHLVRWVVFFIFQRKSAYRKGKIQAGGVAHLEESFPSIHKALGLNPRVA